MPWLPILIFSVNRKWTWFTTRFSKLNGSHVTGVPEKSIFRSVTVYNKNVSNRCSLPAQMEQVQDKLVELRLLTHPEHLSSPPVFSGVRVTQSLVLCVMFWRSLLVLLSFFFWLCWCLSFDLRFLITLVSDYPSGSVGYVGVCSSIYGFWLPLRYLQTLLALSFLTFSRFSTAIKLVNCVTMEYVLLSSIM